MLLTSVGTTICLFVPWVSFREIRQQFERSKSEWFSFFGETILLLRIRDNVSLKECANIPSWLWIEL